MNRVLTHRVRYHETDPQGFMFNSRYLELADVAMTEYFRALGLPYLELLGAGADPSVVSAQLEFRRAALFEDVLDVAVGCTRVGRSSFTLDMSITRAQETVADMRLTYVNVDTRTAAARRLPEAVARRLRTDLEDAESGSSAAAGS